MNQLLIKSKHNTYISKTECITQLLSGQRCVGTSCTLPRTFANQFVEAIVKEVNVHVGSQDWRLIKRSEVPEGKPIQQSVWAMQQKQNLMTGI